MWAVLPLKDLPQAKQRLSAILSLDERRGLFAAMAEDVLAALGASRGLAGILVVTRDAACTALAERYGARICVEPENRGHTAAVQAAAELLRAEGVGGLLQVPGDVPLASAAEIEAVLAAHRAAPAFTIVPSGDRKGSNCIALSPPGAVALRFGDDSFFPHLAAARAVGIEPTVLPLPGLALDIDTPEDLAALLSSPGATRAHAYLRGSGIARRLHRIPARKAAAGAD